MHPSQSYPPPAPLAKPPAFTPLTQNFSRHEILECAVPYREQYSRDQQESPAIAPATTPRTPIQPAQVPADFRCADDATLLRLFIDKTHEPAFAELVRRHGPMVLQVCRRALTNRQDAEDAFQLTFLVLAKKAPQLRHPQLVGNWLYGVALNVSRRSRTALSRRRLAEAQMLQSQPSPKPAGPSPDSTHLHHLIDQEIPRLPAKYRAAIVACYVEGKSNRDAARALDWPLGTLVTRLNRAKSALRARVAARLKKDSDAALAIALNRRTAPAAVPIALLAATLRTARKLHRLPPSSPRSQPTALRPSPRPTAPTPPLTKVQIVGASAFSITLALLGCLALGAKHHLTPTPPAPLDHERAISLHPQSPPSPAPPTADAAQNARAIATALTQSNRDALAKTSPRPRRQ